MLQQSESYNAIPQTFEVSVIGENPTHAMSRSSRDPVIEYLVKELLAPEEQEKVLRGNYTTVLHSTLLKRLDILRHGSNSLGGSRELNPLPKWRLRRVFEHIDANIEERLSLDDLAAVAGISRMYFAAQFRVATGLRPHDFVIQQRIKHAKEMLRDQTRPIVDIALSVGFQTQAHFTTTFKKVVGFTPHRWRMFQGWESVHSERTIRPPSDTSVTL